MRAILAASLLAAAVLFAHAPSSGAAGPPRPPNVVLILADDLGSGELGVQGAEDIPTPHIDSLAESGIRFTRAYACAPLCSPSRAGLLTGRYPQRFGIEGNIGAVPVAGAPAGLPLSETILSERLKALGYATGLVGKWHLGEASEFAPTNRGFDEFFGFLGGFHAYLPPARREDGPILRGSTPVEEPEYLTDAFAREAVDYIGRHAAEPFFLYLSVNAVHLPLMATPEYLGRFGDIRRAKRRVFAAMLSALDDGVGAVLAKLRAEGIEENTLVFFLSDNGGPTRHSTSSNGPLRGGKADVFEGGIRVPFLLQWKAGLPAGQVFPAPVSALDVLPTAIAAAGGVLSPDAGLDGVDLRPWLTGQRADPPHPTLFFRMGPRQRAVLSGDRKLLCPERGKPMLFDLSTDPGERVNIARREPGTVSSLLALFEAWSAELP